VAVLKKKGEKKGRFLGVNARKKKEQVKGGRKGKRKDSERARPYRLRSREGEEGRRGNKRKEGRRKKGEL